MNDEDCMQLAISLAHRAEQEGEVPVGAIIILDDIVIGEGFNQPISNHDPSAHAEVIALRNAAKKIQNYRLPGTTLYVTLEPCAMCAGAMIQARVSRLVFGAYDVKTGAAGSVFDLVSNEKLNHKIKISGGVMQDECAKLLQNFFKQRR